MLAKILVSLVTITIFAQGIVYRPCKLNDLACISAAMQRISYCSPVVSGQIPPQYVLPVFRYHAPYFNSSYVDVNLVIRNQHLCRVSEFFINSDTHTAVIGVDCPNLELESKRWLLQHRSLAEDVRYEYHVRALYPLIRLTTNLVGGVDADLCTSHTFAEVTALPVFKVNPNDVPTAEFLSLDLSMLNIYEIEAFFYRGPQLARLFINSLICDFGCT